MAKSLLERAYDAISYLMNHPFPGMHQTRAVIELQEDMMEAINAEKEADNSSSEHDDQG